MTCRSIRRRRKKDEGTLNRNLIPPFQHIYLQGKDDASWGPNNTFRFPLRDGTGAIWSSLYSKIDPSRFKFNARVTEINADKRIITLSDGRWIYLSDMKMFHH